MAEPRDFTIVVGDEEEAAADEQVMNVPGVRAEAVRYEPVVAKLTDVSLLAIYVAVRQETRRRAAKLRRRPVGIGNRA